MLKGTSSFSFRFFDFALEYTDDERRRDLVGIREQEGGRGGEGGGGGAGGRDEAVERQQVGRCADWSLCTYNSIHEYNCVTAKWTLLTPVFSNGSSCPSPRRQASMVRKRGTGGRMRGESGRILKKEDTGAGRERAVGRRGFREGF